MIRLDEGRPYRGCEKASSNLSLPAPIKGVFKTACTQHLHAAHSLVLQLKKSFEYDLRGFQKYQDHIWAATFRDS